MVISEPQLRCAFRDYNDIYFNSILPMPRFEVIHSFRYFGYFESDIYNNTTLNPVIRISDQYKYTESQFRDILVHEMIHYYLAYIGKDIKARHGKEFNRYAEMLNRDYKLNITKRINMDEYIRREGTSWLRYTLAKIF